MAVHRSKTRMTSAATRHGLVAAAVVDARKQLHDARHATRVSGGDPDYTETRWRREFPGLAALIDHSEGEK